jgi:hypothetical protein
MPEEGLHSSESNRAEEVVDAILPADHQPSKVMEPSEETPSTSWFPWGGAFDTNGERENCDLM